MTKSTVFQIPLTQAFEIMENYLASQKVPATEIVDLCVKKDPLDDKEYLYVEGIDRIDDIALTEE